MHAPGLSELGRAVDAAGPVAILAGAGELPTLIADRMAATGRPCRILALRGFADRALTRRSDAVVGLLDIKATVACLDAWRPGSVTLAGAVRRPGAAALVDAFSLLRNRDEIARVIGRGDDHVLRGVIELLEERGHRLVGVHDLAPELLADVGTYGRVRPDAAALRGIEVGFGLLDDLSRYDIGQSAVIRGERILAIEGAEGTDGMIARAGRFRGRRWRRGRLLPSDVVMVKGPKRGQDLRVDLPAIGPITIANAARAGFAGVAVAGRYTLVIDRARTVAEADRRGLFLVGIDRGWSSP